VLDLAARCGIIDLAEAFTRLKATSSYHRQGCWTLSSRCSGTSKANVGDGQYRVIETGSTPRFGQKTICWNTSTGRVEEVEGFRGRVIVDAGQGDSLTSRPFREPTGKKRYVLAEDHLPPHSHEVYRHAGMIVGNTGTNGSGEAVMG
jgi:hypothetical protein